MVIALCIVLGYSVIGNVVYRELERRSDEPKKDNGRLRYEEDAFGLALASALWPIAILALGPRWALLSLDGWRADRRERLRLERAAKEKQVTSGAYR